MDPHPIRRAALRALRLLLLTYGGVTLMAATLADRMIFVPPPPSYGADAAGLVRLATAAGDTVAAVYLPVPDAPFAVVFAHGNAEDLGDLGPYLEAYRSLGVSVLAFDYPGYGMSTGTPSEAGAYAAADAAYDYLAARIPGGGASIVVHGRSLGGGVLVDVAARRPVAGLVLESTFVSAYRVMTRIPLLPVDQFRSLKKLPAVGAPVLVIHGTADQVIAPWHGRRLAEAVPAARRRTLWVEGAGHNDLLGVAGDDYWSALRSFFADLGSTR